jgi:hypothetical protein
MSRPDEDEIHESNGSSPTHEVTTKFKYPSESQFIGALREGVHAGKSRLQEGYPIQIRLKPGGYAGKGTVIISADDPKKFGVAGAIKHPDRFSRRIRVAAWALFEEEVFGHFLIKHYPDSGTVTIEREDNGIQGTTTSPSGEQGGETSGGVLVIVPCGRNKVWDENPNQGSVQAKDAYTSRFFTTNRAFAEKFGSRWVILSAKYGFIRPDFQISGPYNVSFKDPATQPVEIHTLIDQIKELGLGEAKRVIGLGGKEYRAMIEEAFAPFGCPLSFPFAGLGIGEMTEATKRAIESGKLSG